MQNDTKQFQNFKKHQILHNKSLLKLINDCTRKAVTKLASHQRKPSFKHFSSTSLLGEELPTNKRSHDLEDMS